MFDAQAHFELVNGVLSTDRGRFEIEENELRVETDWDNWSIITWRATIRFSAGHVLAVAEMYKRDSDGSIGNSFGYHLMDDQKQCIFRFDTHGECVAIGEPCHVHLGEELFENGDPRLCGYSLQGVDFFEAYKLSHMVFKSERLPWD